MKIINLVDYQKPQLLDVVSKEIFFCRRVLFLEGQEDVGILRELINIDNISIFGYGVGGAQNMKHFLSLAQDLNIKAAALFDSPDNANDKEEIERCKNVFPGSYINILPTKDIRDKPDKSIIGICNSRGELKQEYVRFIEGINADLRKHLFT